jgi:hypothetical protein
MNFDEDVAKELRNEDGPLEVNGPLFHATRNLAGIQAAGALLSLGAQRQRGAVAAGFGHRVIGSGENHVSLTTSRRRGRGYFHVLVVLAAIAEGRVAVADWLAWYFVRWVDDRERFLKTINDDSGADFPGAFADALDRVGVVPGWRDGDQIWQDLVAQVGKLDVTARLAWLFELDAAAMQHGDDLDNGLGVVGAVASDWVNLQLSDVALLKVNLPFGATGHPQDDEDEFRVAGELREFEVIATGEARFKTWPW